MRHYEFSATKEYKRLVPVKDVMALAMIEGSVGIWRDILSEQNIFAI